MGGHNKAELLLRLETIRQQGGLARAAGNTDLELGLREQAYDIISELHGPESLEALRAWGQIGLALFESRRFGEAETLFSELHARRVDLLGQDHEETLSTRGNYAKSMAQNGRPNEALLVLRRLHADRVRLLGDRHESTLATRGMIAHALLLAGEVERSIQAYEALLEDQIEELGETHPNVAVTLSNLTVIRARTSEWGSVREQEALVNEYASELGNENPQTLAQKHLLAETYIRNGRYIEGQSLIDQVLASRLTALGELDPGTLAARGLRAQVSARLGRVDEAFTELMDCLRCWEARGAQNERHALVPLVEAICIVLRRLEEMATESSNPARLFEKLVVGSTYVSGVERLMLQLESAVVNYEPSHPLRQFVEEVRRNQ